MAQGVLVPSYRQRLGYHAGLLGGIALLASGLLSIGDLQTREPIAERRAEDLKASLAKVIPNELHDNDLLADVVEMEDPGGNPLTIYRATREGSVQGVAFQVSGPGYAGPITSVLGIDRDGKLLGVRVIAHAETPGLGDKMEEAKGDWIFSFDGLSLGNPPVEQWAVKKDGGRFDQFTGATITPRGIVRSVREGLEFFGQHQKELLKAPEPAASGEDEPSDAKG